MLIYLESLPDFCNHQVMVSIVAPLKYWASVILECRLLSVNLLSICFFPSGEVQVNLRNSQRGEAAF